MVQFLIHQTNTESYLSSLLSNAPVPEAHLLCLSQDESVTQARPTDDISEECVVIQNRFIAASEGGFSLDEGRSQSGLKGIWKCTTPHVYGSISFPQ
jgi:hypothetical protein